LLDVLPGVAAVLGGLALIVSARRASGVAGGWLALMGGVWFLLGPSISLFWSHATGGPLHSGIGTPLGGNDRAAVEFIGFFYGLGALITGFSALAIGRFASRPGLVDEPTSAPVTTPESESESLTRRQDAETQTQEPRAGHVPHRCQAGQSRKRVRSLPRRALIRHVVAGTLAGGFRSSTSEAMLGILREISTDYLANTSRPGRGGLSAGESSPWDPARFRARRRCGQAPRHPPARRPKTPAFEGKPCGRWARYSQSWQPHAAASERPAWPVRTARPEVFAHPGLRIRASRAPRRPWRGSQSRRLAARQK
jgi:hypothetical protein